MSYRLSSFRKNQLVFEMRYSEAYLIWDRAGGLWKALGARFKTFKTSGVAPSNVTFNADRRYTLTVAIDRAAIVDHSPEGSVEPIFDLFSFFAQTVIRHLAVRVLDRVGIRSIYTIDFKSREDVYKRAQEAISNSALNKTYFNIEPTFVAPVYKVDVDDGDVGYTAQLYSREYKLEFQPPPDAATLGVLDISKTINQLALDVDFATKKPVPIEGLDVMAWLIGWNKALVRDADAFLENVAGAK